ncbi:MAG: hypothetical protein ACNA8H_01170 [Anaerolineales bacterium]
MKLLKRSILIFSVSILMFSFITACSPDESNELQGGVLAEFEVVGDTFKVWVTNPDTIQQLYDLQDGVSQANIPNGRIHHGPGQADHNEPWSWHLDPQDIEMAEMTIELCDGALWFIEEEIDYFVETVQRFCPWEAGLVSLEDYR